MAARVLRLMMCVIAISAAGRAAGLTPERIEREFPFSPGGTLNVESYRGALTIEESDDAVARVAIDVDVEADTPEAARRARANLNVDFVPGENGLRVVVTNRQARVRFVWQEDAELGLFLRVSVPRHCNASLKVTNGSITVGALAGRVRAEVETGNIVARRIEGSLEARAVTGEVIVSRCTGDVSVQVLRGLIRTGTLGGRAVLRNDSGDVEVTMAHAAVDALATAGDVSVGFSRHLNGPSLLRADGGNIRVAIDPTTPCEITAAASWGRVRSKLPLEKAEGANGAKRLRGQLNGGGPLIDIRASGGSVRLEPGDTFFELEPKETPAAPRATMALE